MTTSSANSSSDMVTRKPSQSNSGDAGGGDGDHERGVLAVAPLELRERPALARPQDQHEPNRIISPATSFGIMPAPGIDRLPNGRSPLSANTSAPRRDEEGARDMVGAQGHAVSLRPIEPEVATSHPSTLPI